MSPFYFSKFQAAGNDFILIDARDPQVRAHVLAWSRSKIAELCDRRFGIGADGLMFLLHHPEFDFEMRNYNSDGGESTMCGNGARAITLFAHQLGILKDTYHFFAADGEHESKVDGDLIHVKMKDVAPLTSTPFGMILDTGSPHLIHPVSNLADYPVVSEGRRIRHSSLFPAAGINVNFVEEIDGKIFVRTYERGVEDETLSCGTGVIATALVTCKNEKETWIHARGGILKVHFERKGNGFQDVWLIGPAVKTFEGTIN